MPASHRRSRPSPALYRWRRLGAAAVLMATIVVVLLLAYTGGGHHHLPQASHPVDTAATAKANAKAKADAPAQVPPPIPAVEAGVLPWNLSSPVSREVVVPGPASTLILAGGLGAAQESLAGVTSLDVTSGNETVIGHLAAPVHDAAGAVIGGAAYVFGGGSPTTFATVQTFPAPGAGTPSAPPPAWTFPAGAPPGTAAAPVVINGITTTATAPNPSAASTSTPLPSPRSDLAAVAVGATTYLVGGYDGTTSDGTVWSTTDGQHFTTAGKLAVPVRYGAAAGLGGKLYVFGGTVAAGFGAGTSTADVQVFDPATGHTSVAGQLPQPLTGAAAFDLGGHLYVAGGQSGAALNPSIWAWDPAKAAALPAGRLMSPVAYAGYAVQYGRGWIVGGEVSGQAVNTVQMVVPNPGFGTAGAAGAGSPYFGYRLMVADRGNDRLIVMSPGDAVGWTYPSASAAAPPGGFYFPDDAFFARHGTEIISNQEENQTIVIISFPSGQLLWQYGHPLVQSSAPGYLSWPDDAYLLKDGEVAVADDRNCRVLFINPDKSITAQLGTTSSCIHSPPTGLASPNGDTPLQDGNYLISEIDGQWVSEYTHSGQLVWTAHLAMHYPSDPQQLGADLYLISDYAQYPGGAIDEFDRTGQILYHLQPQAGICRMNQPSLAELVPSGVFMTNDDYRDRMAAFDPATGALVWQYGVADSPGTGPGYLNTPDGFDLLGPDGSTPTHPATG